MKKIKQLREQIGMTQKELANLADISAPFLLDLERGNRGAKPETLKRIADALGVEVNDLSTDE